MKNIKYIYIIREAGYEDQAVLFVSLNEETRNQLYKKLDKKLKYMDIAKEDIPLDHYRSYSLEDWKPVLCFSEKEVNSR